MTDINYNRPALNGVVDTPIDVAWEAAESPAAEAAIGVGSTGIMTATLTADADPGVGTDVQDLFKIVATPTINVTTGKTTLTIEVTPVYGGGTDGNASSLEVVHPQTMDAWQTAAGQARVDPS